MSSPFIGKSTCRAKDSSMENETRIYLTGYGEYSVSLVRPHLLYVILFAYPSEAAHLFICIVTIECSFILSIIAG